MNKASYEGLPAELREVLDDASGIAGAQHGGQRLGQGGCRGTGLAKDAATRSSSCPTTRTRAGGRRPSR